MHLQLFQKLPVGHSFVYSFVREPETRSTVVNYLATAPAVLYITLIDINKSVVGK